MAKSRHPTIMSDAAHVILTSKSSLTNDNFFLDDEVLISSGMTLGNLDKYKDEGTENHNLVQDFMC